LDSIVQNLSENETIPTFSYKLSTSEIQALIFSFGNPSIAYGNKTLNKVGKWVDNQLSSFSNGGFVKLSSRSPKDVTWEHKKTLDSVKNNKTVTLNDLYRAQIDCMRVSSWREALDLLVESSRILFDLQLDVLDPKKYIFLNYCSSMD